MHFVYILANNVVKNDWRNGYVNEASGACKPRHVLWFLGGDCYIPSVTTTKEKADAERIRIVPWKNDLLPCRIIGPSEESLND